VVSIIMRAITFCGPKFITSLVKFGEDIPTSMEVMGSDAEF